MDSLEFEEWLNIRKVHFNTNFKDPIVANLTKYEADKPTSLIKLCKLHKKLWIKFS